MRFTKSNLRRALVTTAAAVLVTGDAEAITANTASAMPRSCAAYNQAIAEAANSTNWAEYYYYQFQDDVAAGNNARAEADSNEFRNWDDNAAHWYEVADANLC